MVEQLISAGAKVDMTNKNGRGLGFLGVALVRCWKELVM